MLAFGGALVCVAAMLVAFIGYKWFLTDEAHRAIKALSADPRAKAAPVARREAIDLLAVGSLDKSRAALVACLAAGRRRTAFGRPAGTTTNRPA